MSEKLKLNLKLQKGTAFAVLLTAPIFFLLGWWLKGCENIGRQAKVTFSGSFTDGTLVSIDKESVVLKDPDRTISLSSVEKIEFLPDETSTEVQLSDQEKAFVGTYKLQVGSHKGILILFPRKSGGIGGTIRFTNWGKGANEILSGLRISGKQIRFIRSCSGQRCAEIGSTVPFQQTYSGELESRKIQGAYQGTNSSGRWIAER
ncbi:hypothetical protein CH373_07335 [Leptospira perolatii]|uniref:Uncharacterized protein n=1 Tax=Leptospira perolatii TaxID=2023191 RepID=A0A2M9ZPE3_9LEPT|nr:hypothetical protein [Leptospira perolatii]PJZ70728.1 hypothetical protein CH360_04195 [Leptospira perolatii]PJZ73937.1 hypothetical protein CH373_07335 [Leptospira perolatii]